MLSTLFRAQQARRPWRFACPRCSAPNQQGRGSSRRNGLSHRQRQSDVTETDYSYFHCAVSGREEAFSWPLLRRRFRLMKEDPGVSISDPLTNDFSNTFTVAPPVLCIIIRIRNRYYADPNAIAEGLLKEKTGPARMCILRHDVETPQHHIVIGKPLPERDCGAIRAVPADYV